MKSFFTFAKLATLMLIFTIGFTQQGHAQRYLTEKVQKDLIVAEGLKVAHTFSNGIKLAYNTKGTQESVVAVMPDGKTISSLGKITTGGDVLTPYTVTVDITASNGCRIKGSMKLFGKNRHLDVDITCPEK
ncbi:MAG: hypothetical protein SFV55_20415 [Haliscomenobacter sp.]|uniref:hypothetical protein n=1 Tax=Haliscomenobacter sp. TaxID=2717303 RepID=UPI0029B54EF0|nr:hypothetical protein [Haliscomenobacter sp.]MDX2070805.1 hypothetical protein [Haliscomenobacter sp.]